jgi:hypothetical protein
MKSVAFNQIAEVELMYKSKVKPSERPRLVIQMMLILSSKTPGMKTRLNCRNSSK